MRIYEVDPLLCPFGTEMKIEPKIQGMGTDFPRKNPLAASNFLSFQHPVDKLIVKMLF
jgi:hypothetical protein